MDRVIRKYDSFDEMKAEEYREWQRLSGRERLDAAAALSLAAYHIKDGMSDARPRLQRTLVHLQRTQS